MSDFVRRLGVWPYLFLGLSLLALGLLAMNYIVDNIWPFDVTRLDLVRATAQGRADAGMLLAAANTEAIVAFLASAAVAVTGFFLPIMYFLNRRFHLSAPPGRPPSPLVVFRQALWVGLWVGFCLWLQMNRTFGVAVAALAAAVLVLFEMLLQIRNRAATVGQQEAAG